MEVHIPNASAVVEVKISEEFRKAIDRAIAGLATVPAKYRAAGSLPVIDKGDPIAPAAVPPIPRRC